MVGLPLAISTALARSSIEIERACRLRRLSRNLRSGADCERTERVTPPNPPFGFKASMIRAAVRGCNIEGDRDQAAGHGEADDPHANVDPCHRTPLFSRV